MGYSIHYPGDRQMPPHLEKNRIFSMTVLFLMIFLFAVISFWPKGREVLQAVFLPCDMDAALEAAEVFARELGNGSSLTEAAKVFCLSVMEHGISN